MCTADSRQSVRNFPVTFAVSNRRGLVHNDIFEGGMTCERFKTFLQATFHACHDSVTYIFDNASYHADRQANDRGPEIPDNHLVKRLPPYSPFLNVVEVSFKASLKQHLEKVRDQLLLEPQP